MTILKGYYHIINFLGIQARKVYLDKGHFLGTFRRVIEQDIMQIHIHHIKYNL